jgi:S1-C subfamily serine protease
MDDPPGEPRRTGWAGRLLPRSVLGISALILAAALGAAFSGAVLYAYYEFRADASDDQAKEFAETFAERLETAVDIIDAEGDEARQLVRDELEPLEQLAATGQTLERLRTAASPSVFFVSTLAEDGSPSVGTGFVVFSDAEQSYLLTSLATVKAATREPRPAIKVRQGDEEIDARLVSWEDDGAHDLALLSIDRGNIERLPWAEGDPVVGVGERVFAVSGLGAGGGAVAQGLVGDVSGIGIQHDAPVGPQFQGAPLLNSNGEVVGIASRAYAPLGFAPDAVWFAPLIRSACERVLQCPG